ncbi:ABC transporter permease [Parapedobacter indicus]|uniref:Putative ABC transport system permease protein n=1 Tax=Parapedobacter indicus TaxID=1477437 RepID=A0A1I3HE60_9SPHI|nr:ABC transporter permease [Parapedobacter indicus]PPL02996.1 putative ABC transport system permease protein [Parapedobacter indicus]SFI33857.1 putative ABC transport system permease protein [Parapedobacter indicus]
MIKNLLLVALRNFKRDKWYSLLNILGLTIGITFSLFLIFYIQDELSYDRYHEKADRIFRVESYIKEPEKDTLKWVSTPFPMAPALSKDYPEVEEAVRLVGNGNILYKKGELSLYQDKVFFADSNVFRVFTHPFLEGDPKTALVAPNSMVLTQSVAEKYFGKAGGYVGKSLENTNGDVYKITGVVEDVPKNSHIIFNVLISRSSLPADFANNWGGFGFNTYVLLKPQTNAASFEQKLLPMYDKYLASIFAQFQIKIRFGIRPITAIHLHSDMEGEPEELGNISYIYIFSAAAFFMLLIACINYMNLTTARSARRSKEIGIRKVTGSSRWQLISQFLVESILTALFALLLSLGLIALLLPVFNSLSGKSISFDTLLQARTLLTILAVVVFVGLMGGSYPALYLSKFNPVSVLKGSLSKSSSNVTLRRALVVVQFSISIIMLICTWVVYNQLAYLRSKDLGFNKDQVLTVTANSQRDVRSKILSFKNEMRQNPQVLAVSTSQAVPGANINFNLFTVESKSGFVDKGVFTYGIDEDYFNTLGMEIVQGRNFSGLSDTLRSIIVNERMVKEFEWGENAIGKTVKFPGDTSGNSLEVVGVVKDFNQQSLYNPIASLILFYRPNSNNIQLKLDPRNIPATVARVEQSWKALFPELPFQYTFLDQDFDSQYAADQKRGKLFTTFSVLTVLVTCLGLLGLIAFITEQRQKEISIRKVLGASVGRIIPLITGNFVVLVGLACLIAFPVAWYFMDKWLQLFTYNTGLSVMPFLLSAIAVLVMTMATVLFHTIRAATANPVNSLRDE